MTTPLLLFLVTFVLTEDTISDVNRYRMQHFVTKVSYSLNSVYKNIGGLQSLEYSGGGVQYIPCLQYPFCRSFV